MPGPGPDHGDERFERLLRMTDRLVHATTPADVAAAVIGDGVTALGALTAGMWVVEEDALVMLSSVGYPPGYAALERIPLAGDAPIAHAARTGEAVYLASRADYAARFPSSAARNAAVTPSELAIACLPVLGEDRTIGAIALTYREARELSDADRAYLALVARTCGQTLARLRLQADTELLYRLVEGVNATDDLAAAYDLALAAVVRATRADRVAILVHDDAGVMRFRAWRDLSDQYRAAVEGHTPWPRDARDPAPVTIADTEADPGWAAYRETFRAEGIRALAFIPIAPHRRLLGKLMVYADRPRAFTPRELRIASTVATKVGHAIQRRLDAAALARSLAEERAARALADEATVAREEILSVVSHDLRNPLGAILLGAASLLGVDPGAKHAPRIRTNAERIQRQAERMARLIEDLVDFAGIQAGRLAIDRGVHDPRDIVGEASEIFEPIAEERGLRFAASLGPELPRVDCDRERAVQVLSNLLANAVKVTARGGEIAVGAERRATDVVFWVRDSGPGIPPADLPLLFERYWRSPTTPYKGSGLGLSIAKGIVEAHGCRIWAESALGEGSTFLFSLRPVA
jgi:signal transduction histidine kinase